MSETRERFVKAIELNKNLNAPIDMIVVLVKLPTGALETIINSQQVDTKIQYYLNAYDDDFKLKNNPAVQIVGFMLG